SLGSKVAPRALPQGKTADRGPVHDVPLAPAGPSLIRISGMPAAAGVCQESRPDSTDIDSLSEVIV
ncbi:MAG: hypothetical protein VYE42_02420, partial [Actinomycetota bacterium]|nr:hypothetical protein [Actinomycetota bacterium]